MTEDLLKEATRALREDGDEVQGSDLTRARIMLSLHAAKRKRRGRLAFGVPLVAVFVAGAAAAQISGALPRAIDRVVETFSSDRSDAPPSKPTRSGAGPAPALVSATPSEPDPVPPPEETDPAAEPVELGEEDTAPPSEPRGEEDSSREPEPRAQLAPPKAPVAAAPMVKSGEPAAKPEEPVKPQAEGTPTPSASAPLATDPSHRRYLEAHQAHFGAHDYARALTLWERYLQEFPRGRFSAEAQYNRALCLVRLGRSSEAKQALEPFASGRYGGYRQTEAQALIKALGG